MTDDRAIQNLVIEKEWWVNRTEQDNQRDPLETLAWMGWKMSECRVLLDCIQRYRSHFASAHKILELGSGEAWGSCAVKRLFPEAKVYNSDIVEDAYSGLGFWEDTFGVKLDGSLVATSYEIPVESGSLDLVFAFSAAHHFVSHRKTLKEIYRVLRPGGVCLYLREPSCKAFIYPMAYRRVNNKRPDCPEDVLRFEEILKLARENGFDASFDFDCSTVHRMPLEGVYYLALGKLPALRSILPCSGNYTFKKPA